MRNLLVTLVLTCSTLAAQEPGPIDQGGPKLSSVRDHVEMYAGNVVIRTTGNRILVMLDTVVDKSAAPDGLVDQRFVLETAQPPTPLFAHLPDALLVHSTGVLTVTTAEQRFEFLLLDTPFTRDDALEGITTRVLGIGLSHNIGKSSISIARQVDRRGNVTTDCEICDPENPDPGTGGGGAACGAGGPGSTSCSVTSSGNSCSVACAAGYYACCNGVAGSTYCRCVKS